MPVTVLPTVPRARDQVGKVDGDVEVVLGKSEDRKLASPKLDQFYVWPEGSRPNIVHDYFDFELPIVDLSPVLKLQELQKALRGQYSNGQEKTKTSALEDEIKACSAAKANVEKEIRAACEEYGFFQIINHGFPTSLVEQLTQTFIRLFGLPVEVKKQVSSNVSGALANDPKARIIGYNAIDRSNAFTRTNNSHIWHEGFELELPELLYPGATEEIASTLWPDEIRIGQQWRSTAEEYAEQASRVSLLLLDLMAGSLGLPEGSVEDFLGYSPESQALARLRANHFPVCAQPELTWGIHGHRDPSVLTLLHQDEVGGLQVGFKDGTWHGIRPIPGAFVVNVGDLGQAWTNGRFISAKHRVVANNKTPRYSIAYFVRSEHEHVIRPRREIVDTEHPLRYRPFSIADYLNEIYSGGLNSTAKEHLLDRAFAAEIQA